LISPTGASLERARKKREEEKGEKREGKERKRSDREEKKGRERKEENMSFIFSLPNSLTCAF
jgi:hypothetical protein